MQSSGAPLAEFAHGHQPSQVSSRVVAGLLTVALYVLLVLLAGLRNTWKVPDPAHPPEVIATLLPDAPPIAKVVLRAPPFRAHLITPHAEAIAPPAFTVAPDEPVAPATLQASAAKSSVLPGGTPAGAGTNGQAASANSNAGNGATLTGCWDRTWAQAVSDRVRRFLYYPRRRLHGVAIVHLIVRRDGRLELVEIDRSSGHNILDHAATDIVRRAQPLPPIPERMHLDRAEGLLPIEFGSMGGKFAPSDSSCSN